MKRLKDFLAEADTSDATKTEMAIVYAYNKINFPEVKPAELLVMGNMTAKKWNEVKGGVRTVGKKTAEDMVSNSIGGEKLMHAGSSSADTKYKKPASDTTSKADLYSDDSSQRFSLKATGGAQLMSAKSGEAAGVFHWGLQHCIQNTKEILSKDKKDAILQVLETDMKDSSRSKMFVEVGKSKEVFADWFILKSKRDDEIEKEFTGAGWNKYDTTKYLELKGTKYTVRDIDSKVKKNKAGNDWYLHLKAELQILNIVTGNSSKAKEKLFKFPSYKLLKKLVKNKIDEGDVTEKDYKQLKPLNWKSGKNKTNINPYYQEFLALGGATIGDVKVSAKNLKKIPAADLINNNLRKQIVDVIQISVESQGWKDILVESLTGQEELKKWIVYEAASGLGKFKGKVSKKSSYKGGTGPEDNAVANKLLVFQKAGGIASGYPQDIMKWSMNHGSLIDNMDISFKGSGTARYIKFGVPTTGVKVESVMHEEAKTVLDNIVDNEFIKLEAEIYHLGQLDEGFLDYIKGTYKKAKDYAVAAAEKLKKMVVKFYENVINGFIKNVGEWITEGFDYFMKMMGLEIEGSVSIKDASF